MWSVHLHALDWPQAELYGATQSLRHREDAFSKLEKAVKLQTMLVDAVDAELRSGKKEAADVREMATELTAQGGGLSVPQHTIPDRHKSEK
jgi:hypothetical protein